MQVACQKDAAPEGQNLGGRKQEGQEIPRLPTSTKICYALGGAPYQLTGNVISFFLQIFLLDVVQLDAFWTSSVIFVGRAWDSISDPIIGYLVSKSPLRKCGKLIPWTLGSTPFGVLMYCLLWYTPSDDLPNSWKFFWYLTTYCFFQTCLSCYHVPYTSMTMFLGGSQSDRDSVTAYRMAIEILSTLIGSGLQGLIVGKHQAKIISNCQGLNGSLSNETVSNYTFPSTETLKNARASYMIAALVISSLYCFSCAILVLGVQEQHEPPGKQDQSRLPFIHSLFIIMSHRTYTILLSGFLFISMAFQMAQGIFAFFCAHAAGLSGYFQYLLLILLVVACFTIPFWQWFLVKFGKKTTIFVGFSLIFPGFIIFVQVTNSFLTFAFIMVLMGCSIAVLFLLPWSMLPDTIDDFQLKNPTCHNLEAFFYSFFIFVNKFGGGLALGISTMCLHFAGYHPGTCKPNPMVILVLRVLMAPVPITLLIIGLTIFCFYPIDKKKKKEIQAKMEAAKDPLY
ncbi:sodium-dependent lysophosphatidylcholine symporter 1-like isoform X3 [Antechinus flavipes]|uniref:sodium-dependent lysophosphatidylcholine symporter 1-like isoform X3 n=1 Tax=Antechinus flavipes TaxID=38775 RepID=UPI002236311B|nr:sodium-dependent lysophosphatidylcholine symporter 1-like isoform X3 [Antechinus flavipes]XP_051835445.1 sodium-dependent lysophosphatidylcholine symporter 1-like isoform X3 [Antechinus flavipes]